MSSPSTLVLFDGDLPSLVAASLARDEAGQTGSAAVLPTPPHRGAADALGPTLRAAAEAIGLDVLESRLAPSSTPTSAAARTAALLAAARAAADHGDRRLVSPWMALDAEPNADRAPGDQPTVETLARELDRAVLVARLIMLDATDAASFAIDTPLADLSDAQVADLAVDLDVPVWRCWWWSITGGKRSKNPELAEKAQSCRTRWVRALQSVGWEESTEQLAAAR
ncbi:MAG: hypothetical protein AAFX79_02295 [Planctomycetota bacterium]